MALQTKTITANGSKGHHKFQLILSELSTDITTNKSKMGFDFKLSPIYSAYDWYGWNDKITYTIKIGDNTYTGIIPNYDGYSTVTLYSNYNIEIEHENNGSKTIPISFTSNDTTGQTYTSGNASASDTMQLSTIPRASTVSVIDTIIGETATIKIKSASASFTHTLTYSFKAPTGSSISIGTIATKTLLTEVPFEIPTKFYQQIPNDTYGICTIKCTTYDGNTQIGSTQNTQFKAKINEELSRPIITSTTLVDNNTDTTDLTGDSAIIVRNASTIKLVINAQTRNYATLKNVYVNQEKAVIDSSSTSSGITTLTAVYSKERFNSNELDIVVIDSREQNNSTYKYQSIDNTKEHYFSTIDYFAPTINVGLNRHTAVDNMISLDYTGKYFNGNFSTSNPNNLYVGYRYKESTETNYSDWLQLSPASTGNSFSQDFISTAIFDYTKIYNFEVKVEDELNALIITNLIVKKGIPVFWWDDSKVYIGENSQVATLDNHESYSTDEIPIGTWIDGKTIYRKVFVITDTFDRNNSIDKETGYNDGDISGIVKISGMIISNTRGYYYPLLNISTNAFLRKTSGKYMLRLTTTSDYSGYTIYAILEVTK